MTAPRNMVVCADDFGANAGIDLAVLKLADMGRLNATSCLTQGPSFRQNALSLKGSGLQTGVHINFTENPGCRGLFLPLGKLLRKAYAHRLDPLVLRDQIVQQLDMFEEIMKRPPDFIDGHQHVHQFPQIRDVLLSELSTRYGRNKPWLRSTRCSSLSGIPLKQSLKAYGIAFLGAHSFARQATARGFRLNRRFAGVYDFQGGEAAYAPLLAAWLANLRTDDLLMCHPAAFHVPEDALGRQRQAEYTVLASDHTGQWLKEHSIVLSPRVAECKENIMTVPVKPITDNFAVAPQLTPEHMKGVAQAGFKSVIINRPDFEDGPAQPASADVIKAAREAGLQVEYLPVVSGSITADDVSRFAQLLDVLPGPVLAYCRSGGRCTSLYNAVIEQQK